MFVFTSVRHNRENSGEAAVRKLVSTSFPGSNYYLFNNVTLKAADGTTQIDHILISRNGVFVIDTKHYSGWIFGEVHSKVWNQVIYRIKHKFQNPIHQNFKHLTIVRALLDFIPPDSIFSIVVFTGDGVFKTKKPDGVFYIEELVKFITSKDQEVMSENRLQFCVGRIETARKTNSQLTDIEHKDYLNRKFGEIN